MRRSAELNAYSLRHSPSITTMQASRFQICGNVGNGIHCGTIRDFKKSSPVLNQRQFTSDTYAIVALVLNSDSSGYFKNIDLLGNAPERALLRGHGDAV